MYKIKNDYIHQQVVVGSDEDLGNDNLIGSCNILWRPEEAPIYKNDVIPVELVRREREANINRAWCGYEGFDGFGFFHNKYTEMKRSHVIDPKLLGLRLVCCCQLPL